MIPSAAPSTSNYVRDTILSHSSIGSRCTVTAVRLKVEQNQLVDVIGEIGVGVDGLEGA